MRFYRAKQARHELGDITPNALKKLVDRGKLKRYTPPEGGQEVYSKDEVDALARQKREFWGEDLEEDDRNARRIVDYSSRSKAVQC